MHNPNLKNIFSKNPLISDQVDIKELKVILREITNQLEKNVSTSAIVEFGCYIGTTSLFIRRLLDIHESSIEFHVYDSFIGLPPKTVKDLSPAGEQFKTGELAVSRKVYELQFKKTGLKLPIIHKGWFSELTANDVPDNICFAYLDGDYYESIRDSLCLVTPHLSPKATIVIDDYANEALPGAARAVDEWLRDKKVSLRVEASLAIITI